MYAHHCRVLGAVLAAGTLAIGCTAGPMTTRERGILGGTAVGAASGAMIGSASGDTAEGALIGAAVGALAGVVIGDSAQAQEEAARNRALVDELRARDLDARGTDRGVVVNFPDVLFEFGRAEVTRGAHRKIASMVDVLQSPNAVGRRISVEGHTDSIGGEQSNLDLSERRARAVADALVGQGVDGSRLSMRGFGESYPVEANTYSDGRDNPQGRARNRRVEVIILNQWDEQAAQPAQYPAQQPAYQAAPQYQVYPTYPPAPPPVGYPAYPAYPPPY
ncbi:MAG: OmpA family protein [Deltaproteobacteria bacterium]|nr:OmpA family protein [Deltaproteobacteria bacterium]